MATFGEKMKAIRFHLGYTQEEIAKRLGVSKQVISKYEKELTSPRMDTVANFAEVLRIDLVFLVNEEFSTSEVIHAVENRNFSVMPLLKKKAGSERPPKTSYSPTLVKLVKTAQNLNDEGQGKLSDYADDLDSSGKYRKLNDAPDTYKDKSSIIRIEPKDEQTNKKPLPFVASSSMWDEGENDEDLAEMIKKLKEDEIDNQ